MTNSWDVFISHASEDKSKVAEPLTHALTNAGLSVWLDRFELHVGDSLREKIDEGLSNSRYGVVILSPDFLKKPWPKAELNALLTCSVSADRRILPVWHNVNREDLATFSPLLSDRVGIRTERGIHAVAVAIIESIRRTWDRSWPAPRAALQYLFDLVEAEEDIETIKEFLGLHYRIIETAMGQLGAFATYTYLSPRVADTTVDLALMSTHTGQEVSVHILQLSEFGYPLVRPGQVHSALHADLEAVGRACSWFKENVELNHHDFILSKVVSEASGTIVFGRRHKQTNEDTEYINRLNASLSNVQVRTYDWLMDAARTYLTSGIHDMYRPMAYFRENECFGNQ